jgi:hypothetical protein
MVNLLSQPSLNSHYTQYFFTSVIGDSKLPILYRLLALQVLVQIVICLKCVVCSEESIQF